MRLFLNKKIVAITLFLVLFFILANIYQATIRNFFYLISEPIQRQLQYFGQKITSFLQAISYSEEIYQENIKLQQFNQELLTKIVKLSELEKENVALKESLKIGLGEEFKLVFAQVTGKDISQDSLIIDKGTRDGIKINLPVITQQKVIVGKVTEVFNNFSRVQLISNKNVSFDAKTLGSEVQGLVKGVGDLNVNFELVPQQEKVSEGEIIVTTALSGIFPTGLLVGTVKSVKKSDIETFQRIEINPYFNIKRLDYLFVINNAF